MHPHHTTIKPIHPFPARMAPDLAIDRLKRLKDKSTVLDPMAGSGTVLRHASDLGHSAIGRDLDPLAVLMSKVWTTLIDESVLDEVLRHVSSRVARLKTPPALKWIDGDPETLSFVDFWFADSQQSVLRKLAFSLEATATEYTQSKRHIQALDLLKVSLSRIIITKESRASLARDTSHSRPHRVLLNSSYDVLEGFFRSVSQVRSRLIESPPKGEADIKIGDARSLDGIKNLSIDTIICSPPYLNAIDYMRGHRLSLVWLGHGISELRTIRSTSVGAEKKSENPRSYSEFSFITESMGQIESLPAKEQSIIFRYSEDAYKLMSQVSRVLNSDGRAYFVVGDSCLRGVLVKNSLAFVSAARSVGLKLIRKVTRELPQNSRYLPIPNTGEGSLSKRMRHETVLAFKHS